MLDTLEIDYYVAPPADLDVEVAAQNVLRALHGPARGFRGKVLDVGHLICGTEAQESHFRSTVFAAFAEYERAFDAWLEEFEIGSPDFKTWYLEGCSCNVPVEDL